MIPFSIYMTLFLVVLLSLLNLYQAKTKNANSMQMQPSLLFFDLECKILTLDTTEMKIYFIDSEI